MPAPPFRKNPCEAHGLNCAIASTWVVRMLPIRGVRRHPEQFGADVHAVVHAVADVGEHAPAVPVRDSPPHTSDNRPAASRTRRRPPARSSPVPPPRGRRVEGACGADWATAAAGASQMSTEPRREPRAAAGSRPAPREVGAQLRVVIPPLRAIRVLVEGCRIEVLGRHPEAEPATHRQQQIDARALQEVVRANAVEGVQMCGPRRRTTANGRSSREKWARTPTVGARPVVVVARPLGHPLVRRVLLGLRLLRRRRDAEREGIDRPQHGQAAPPQQPEPVRDDSLCVDAEGRLERLRTRAVRLVASGSRSSG